MNVKLISLLLVILCVGAFASPVPTTSCGDTITENTLLSDSLTDCAGNGLAIGANDIVLDCDGYEISGTESDYGIDVSDYDGITIKNCVITNFSRGIRLGRPNPTPSVTPYNLASDNNQLINNTITDSQYSGVYVGRNSKNNTISDGEVSDNNVQSSSSHAGIAMADAVNTTITDVDLANNLRQAIYAESGSTDLTVTNNNITGTSDHGVYLSWSDNATIEDNTIEGVSNTAIYIDGAEHWFHARRNVLLNSTNGIYVQGPAYQDDVVTYNKIYNMTDYGMYFEYMTNATISHNIIDNVTTGEPETCIYATDVHNSFFINNTISNCGTYGMDMQSSDNVTIEDSDISNVGDSAIYAFGASNWMHVNNNLLSNSASGLYLDSVYTNDIFNYNQIYNMTDYGMYLNWMQLPTVSHNIIDNVTSGECMFVGAVSNGTFANNTLSECGQSGMYLTSSHYNTISDGYIHDNNDVGSTSHAGIYLSGSNDNTISGMTMHDNTWGAVQLVSSDRNTIDESNIYDNCGNEWQIRCRYSTHLTISNSNVTDGTGDGIRAESSEGGYCTHMTVTNNNISGNGNSGVYAYGIDHSRFSNNVINDNSNDGFRLYSTENFTSTNDEYSNPRQQGAVVSDSGVEEAPEFINANFHDNDEGLRLQSSTAVVRNSDFTDNTGNVFEEDLTGIYVSGSDLYLYNSNFENNGDYAIYEDEGDSIHWEITEDVICKDNNIQFAAGSLSMLGGSLTATNCRMWIGEDEINLTSDQSGYQETGFDLGIGENQTFNTSGFELTITANGSGYDGTITATTYSDIPEDVSGFSLSKLGTWMDFNVTGTTAGQGMAWAIIKMYYTDAQLTAAGLTEDTLEIQYYNETDSTWTSYGSACGESPCGGINTTEKYVWANTTHFSGYGVFGTAPSAPSGTGPTRTIIAPTDAQVAMMPTVTPTPTPEPVMELATPTPEPTTVPTIAPTPKATEVAQIVPEKGSDYSGLFIALVVVGLIAGLFVLFPKLKMPKMKRKRKLRL